MGKRGWPINDQDVKKTGSGEFEETKSVQQLLPSHRKLIATIDGLILNALNHNSVEFWCRKASFQRMISIRQELMASDPEALMSKIPLNLC